MLILWPMYANAFPTPQGVAVAHFLLEKCNTLSLPFLIPEIEVYLLRIFFFYEADVFLIFNLFVFNYDDRCGG